MVRTFPCMPSLWARMAYAIGKTAPPATMHHPMKLNVTAARGPMKIIKGTGINENARQKNTKAPPIRKSGIRLYLMRITQLSSRFLFRLFQNTAMRIRLMIP